jgi:hypothetical protein
MTVESPSANVLRRLALSDEAAIGSIFCGDAAESDDSAPGDKVRAMVRLAALIATGSAMPSYQWTVNVALAAGASEAEITRVLLDVAPIVGGARVASAAPAIATALGYELDMFDLAPGTRDPAVAPSG